MGQANIFLYLNKLPGTTTAPLFFLFCEFAYAISITPCGGRGQIIGECISFDHEEESSAQIKLKIQKQSIYLGLRWR